MTHFHGFYNNGQELPTLAKRETEPALWISPADAVIRQIADNAAIRIFNRARQFNERERRSQIAYQPALFGCATDGSDLIG